MDFKCGTEVIADCQNLNTPWGENWTFRTLVGDATETSTVVINIGIGMGAEQMTTNMIKGVGALKCMVLALGNNFWNLLAAGYWSAKFAGQLDEFKGLLDLAEGHVCTCRSDADDFTRKMQEYTGQDPSQNDLSAILGHCSEKDKAAAAANQQNAGGDGGNGGGDGGDGGNGGGDGGNGGGGNNQEPEEEMVSSTGFKCSKDGFVELVQNVTELLLVAVSLIVNTCIALLPPDLGKAAHFLLNGVKEMGNWIGFLVAAIFYFSKEFGFDGEMCEASGYAFMAVDTLHVVVELVESLGGMQNVGDEGSENDGGNGGAGGGGGGDNGGNAGGNGGDGGNDGGNNQPPQP